MGTGSDKTSYLALLDKIDDLKSPSRHEIQRRRTEAYQRQVPFDSWIEVV
jgi:hypothetical protein